jgi:hypothetical protein
LIYALFIAGLFSVLRITSFLGWIQVVVALIAFFFAMINIKDYFWYKEGLSFTISEDKNLVWIKGCVGSWMPVNPFGDWSVQRLF